jgi:hypothetical protein
MGSMTTPLPLPYGEVIRNNWEIIGQFMYPSHATARCLACCVLDCWTQRDPSETLPPRGAARGDGRSREGDQPGMCGGRAVEAADGRRGCRAG